MNELTARPPRQDLPAGMSFNEINLGEHESLETTLQKMTKSFSQRARKAAEKAGVKVKVVVLFCDDTNQTISKE